MNNKKLRRHCVVVAVSLIVCGLPWAAQGSGGWLPSGTYIPVGVMLGWTSAEGTPGGLDAHEGGFTLGVEVSYIVLRRDLVWYGGYLDIITTPSDGDWRVSVGGEVGAYVFGADAGLLIRVDSGVSDVHIGGQVRGLLTLTPFFMPYARTGFFFDDSPGFVEAGVLCKFPIVL